jgi:hypothetical protein
MKNGTVGAFPTVYVSKKSVGSVMMKCYRILKYKKFDEKTMKR